IHPDPPIFVPHFEKFPIGPAIQLQPAITDCGRSRHMKLPLHERHAGLPTQPHPFLFFSSILLL
ncbi:MAG: hypothetical protein P8J44_06655, partial [Gammaproteobacteria bacterium]|nr:hypothetical protein [Gammaproteobacteria bacterium]